MSDSYQIKNPQGLYFLTFQVVGWADVFSRKAYRDIVIDSLKSFKNKKRTEYFSFSIFYFTNN